MASMYTLLIRAIADICADGGFASELALVKKTSESAQAIVNLMSNGPGLCRFHVRTEDKQGSQAVIESTYLIVTSGILAEQHTLQERGIRNTESFKGIITFAGRHEDADSVVNTACAKGKVG